MESPQRNDAFRKYFYRQLDKIAGNGVLTEADRAQALRQLIAEIFERATEQDKLHFSTSFARISYAAHKYGIPNVHIHQERHFRTRRPAQLSTEELGKHVATGYRLATELIRATFGGAVPDEWVRFLTFPYPFPYVKPEVHERFPTLRVLAVEDDAEEQLLYVREEAQAERTFAIPYGENEVSNSLVAQAIAIVRKISGLPLMLNLIGAELRDDGQLYPAQIIVEPDYLIDVTAVAESFDGTHSYQPWTSIAQKLVPYRQEIPLLRGNLVNYFLDRLVEAPEVEFQTLIGSIFQTQPLALCLFDDNQIKDLIDQLRTHFVTLQKFVRQDLAGIDVDREKILLEPTFLCPTYGVQGRLDLLQTAESPNDPTTIVELKTSKYWHPNRHGINQTNYIQTLLYDLMINEALGEGANVRSYILYSADYGNGLKYAPPEYLQKLEAIAARNQLMGVELLLGQLGVPPDQDLAAATSHLLNRLQPAKIPTLGTFSVKDHELVLTVFGQLSDLERRYFGAFLGFTAREQRLAKTGQQKLESINGLASLWLDDRADKIERFELLDGLSFAGYDPSTSILTLLRPEDDDRLVKFRQGDIIALYATPANTAQPQDTIRSQILKSTIIAVDHERVQLRLRSQQLNDTAFRRPAYWSIEKDVLDSSFRNHYQGLFAWAQSTPDFRRRWLGTEAPRQVPPLPGAISPELTTEQNRILQRIITAPDYFLLWGPPGTGKTNQMLHHLVRHLLTNSEECILLVAYTNRAVDEICESLERIVGPDGKPFTDYLRIGSRYGVNARFEDRLLQVKSSQISRRQELKTLIEQTRIFVGTVASVGGKGELFALKSFDRLVVDEASQILEPLLAGLLPLAPQTLLIGDHRQLPAVVQQGPEDTLVHDTALREIGLTNLATSLFERLFLTAQRKGWHWAFDRLRHQGRMHQDIMAFPAQHFYGGELHILPETIAHHRAQLLPLSLASRTPPGLSPAAAPNTTEGPSPALLNTLGTHRLLFLPTSPDHRQADPKVNGHEADLLVELIRAFRSLYALTDRPVVAGDIGIITPYRAQIAHIRRSLRAAGLPPEDFMVDTVERYQGGAKRIVLISLCTNEDKQIQMLSQISEEGVDRKLNVAMTRAREHLVLLGCPAILRQSTVYAALLDFISGQE
ncbi:AAA domain-containing protein [Neolewinella lacunae]|uniref:AAA family ATPase n=1 Tax=Neolewinella lacunae TaxID=1517758 RepID=A0A923T7N1_9BACT|nr:AAA domain-containing protein [Neolewinella lacunae]MBC6993058.1 AAA family ATPase [Neolewinella lacunae]MDN3635880.1 AAA domain-containing protein [Neolewinella lacunae]